MLKYEANISKEELSTALYLNTAKAKINEEIYNLIEKNWLKGLFIKIEKINIEEVDLKNDLHYKIYYEVFEDENYKLLTERLQIGL